MVAESAGRLALTVEAKVTGDQLNPQVTVLAGGKPVAVVPVEVRVRDGQIHYTLPDGELVASAPIAEHTSCPTCGTRLKDD